MSVRDLFCSWKGQRNQKWEHIPTDGPGDVMENDGLQSRAWHLYYPHILLGGEPGPLQQGLWPQMSSGP